MTLAVKSYIVYVRPVRDPLVTSTKLIDSDIKCPHATEIATVL